jgi:hypothetical protein
MWEQFRARSDKWEPVIGANMRQNKGLERRFDSIRLERALADQACARTKTWSADLIL